MGASSPGRSPDTDRKSLPKTPSSSSLIESRIYRLDVLNGTRIEGRLGVHPWATPGRKHRDSTPSAQTNGVYIVLARDKHTRGAARDAAGAPKTSSDNPNARNANRPNDPAKTDPGRANQTGGNGNPHEANGWGRDRRAETSSDSPDAQNANRTNEPVNTDPLSANQRGERQPPARERPGARPARQNILGQPRRRKRKPAERSGEHRPTERQSAGGNGNPPPGTQTRRAIRRRPTRGEPTSGGTVTPTRGAARGATAAPKHPRTAPTPKTQTRPNDPVNTDPRSVNQPGETATPTRGAARGATRAPKHPRTAPTPRTQTGRTSR